MNGPGVERKLATLISIFVAKYSMMHTFMTSCLRKLVRVCLAVISLTAFSQRIFKHKTIMTSNISCENIRQCSSFSADVRICSHSSHLLSFIDIFAWNRQLTFWPTLYDDDVNDETTAVDNRRYYGANAHCGDRLSLSPLINNDRQDVALLTNLLVACLSVL